MIEDGVESHVREVKLARITNSPINVAVIHYSKKAFMHRKSSGTPVQWRCWYVNN